MMLLWLTSCTNCRCPAAKMERIMLKRWRYRKICSNPGPYDGSCGSFDRDAEPPALQHCFIKLCLDECNLGFNSTAHDRDILRSLISILQENSSIEVLCLNQNGFDVTDLHCIMDAITGCCNLCGLELEEKNPEHYEEQHDDSSWLTSSRLV